MFFDGRLLHYYSKWCSLVESFWTVASHSTACAQYGYIATTPNTKIGHPSDNNICISFAFSLPMLAYYIFAVLVESCSHRIGYSFKTFCDGSREDSDKWLCIIEEGCN